MGCKQHSRLFRNTSDVNPQADVVFDVFWRFNHTEYHGVAVRTPSLL
jgi:hypothetical protein